VLCSRRRKTGLARGGGDSADETMPFAGGYAPGRVLSHAGCDNAARNPSLPSTLSLRLAPLLPIVSCASAVAGIGLLIGVATVASSAFISANRTN